MPPKKSKLPAMKGKRTTASKVLSKELEDAEQNSHDRFDSETGVPQISKFEEQLETLQTFLANYQKADEALTECWTESTEDDDVQGHHDLEDDATVSMELISKAQKAISKIKAVLNDLLRHREAEKEKQSQQSEQEARERVERLRLETEAKLAAEAQDKLAQESQQRLKIDEERLSIEKERLSLEERKEKQAASGVEVKFDLKKFDGDRLKWREWWSLFQSTVHKRKDKAPVEKFCTLKSKLTGPAYESIAGLEVSDELYPEAIRKLKERFGNEQLIIDAHYEGLDKLPVVPADNIRKLQEFWDTAEKHFSQLEALGVDCEQKMVLSLLKRKLPRDVKIHLEEKIDTGQEMTVEQLARKYIQKYISVRIAADPSSAAVEASGNQNGHNPSGNAGNRGGWRDRDKKGPRNPEPRGPDQTRNGVSGSGSGSHTEFEKRYCYFCNNETHYSSQCKNYKDLESRKAQVKGRCYNCLQKLSSTHTPKNCPVKKPCYFCKDTGHHQSLCPKHFKAKLPGAGSGSQQKTAGEPAYTALCGDITDDGSSLMTDRDHNVLMQTAIVELTNPETGQTVSCKAILDSCGSKSFISDELTKQLSLKKSPKEVISIYRLRDSTPDEFETSKVQVGLKLKNGSVKNIVANTTDNITGKIRRAAVDAGTVEFLQNNFKLADTIPQGELRQVNLLIGNNYFWDLILPEKKMAIPGHEGLYLIASDVGLLVTGRLEKTEPPGEGHALFFSSHVNQVCPELSRFSDRSVASVISPPNLEDFWKLETIGIKDSPTVSDEDRALDQFNSTVKYGDGRIQVALPKKEVISMLPSNKDLALAQLKSLLKRTSPEMRHRYHDVIQGQDEKTIVETVAENQMDGPLCHYLPHHAVVTPQKETTKVRIVCNGSAKKRKGDLSLNECLYPGPSLVRDLCGMLMRFRLEPTAVVADMEKAFLQLGLQLPDRDLTRFFWIKDPDNPSLQDNLVIYRFCRVPFGLNCSPFELNGGIRFHLKNVGTPVAKQILENTYVDNLLTGVPVSNESKIALEFYKEAKSIFLKVNINLREWNSNDMKLMESIPEEDRAKTENMKCLGLEWNVNEDTLAIAESVKSPREYASTKRQVLQCLASVFDPLGYLSPILVRAKIFLQELWEAKVDWDSPLDQTAQAKWLDIAEDIQKIPTVTVPRFIGSTSWDQCITDLLCFCDASVQAFVTTIYLRIESPEETKVNLVLSRTRLAPVAKQVTLPRLELMAMLIGVRSLNYVSTELGLKFRNRVLWSDSQCVLQWLKSAKPLAVFVENRVKEIKQSDDVSFRYVITSENPADLATRGKTLEELMNSELWWHGPPWLKSDCQSWPTWDTQHISKEIWEEVENEVKDSQSFFDISCHALGEGPERNTHDGYPLGMKLGSFSSLVKLHRVTAWCLRAVKVWKAKKGTAQRVLSSDEIKAAIDADQLTADDICDSKKLWIQSIQQRDFSEVLHLLRKQKSSNLIQQLDLRVDDQSIIRCHGRLKDSELSAEAQFPILLPKESHYTELVVQHSHKKVFHMKTETTLAHVRREYWITSGRAVVKKIIKRCLICKRWDGGPYRYPPMPPLPHARVTQSNPFSYTGVDYFGPFYIKVPPETPNKVWVSLFTCMAVRAVHLELVPEMSTEHFIMALKRFISRRGKPIQITSDNAAHFKLAEKTVNQVWVNPGSDPDVQSFVASEGIRWHFIPEISPWMGGVYERMVGSVKRALKKALGRKKLTFIQLETLLVEVEAAVNSRPLVYVGSELDDRCILTPGDFLVPLAKVGVPELEEIDEADPDYQEVRLSGTENLLDKWKRGQKQLTEFWRIWRDDYLHCLRERSQTHLKQGRILAEEVCAVGDVVLIKDDLPRGSWKIGKVVRLTVSSDGNVRSAKVQLPSKTVLTRPVNLLYPLECSERSKQESVDEEVINSDNQQSDLGCENEDETDETGDDEPASSMNMPVRTRPLRKATEVARGKLASWIRQLNES